MRGLIHDLLRAGIGALLTLVGRLLERVHTRKIRRFAQTQARLRARYQVGPDTPILEYGEALEASIQAFAAASSAPVTFAETSGSTGRPKRIAYTAARVRGVKLAFVDAFARAYATRSIARKSLYVFSALDEDASLTGLLVEEQKLPPYLSGLQAPYRVQSHPAVRALIEAHGSLAVRVFVLAISNPGVLYATNPSTLSTFLDALRERWPEARSLARAFVYDRPSLPPIASVLARRLASRGDRARLARIADSDAPLPLSSIAPGAKTWVSWDGGYVKPFVARVQQHLPPDRFLRLPMYSMSTETLETIPDYSTPEVAFLPLARGVLYELLPEGAPDRPEFLLGPFPQAGDDEENRQTPAARGSTTRVDSASIDSASIDSASVDSASIDSASIDSASIDAALRSSASIESAQRSSSAGLEVGGVYALVVSDAYGLRRYQTGDLFECVRFVRGLPDLRFARRRGLEYSFTGEKLTGEQARLAVEALRADGMIPAEEFATFVPSHPKGASIPHYLLIVLSGTPPADEDVARAADAQLCLLNPEYAHKRATGRLGPVSVRAMEPRRFAERLRAEPGWESQFKFLPLVRCTWEEMGGAEDGSD